MEVFLKLLKKNDVCQITILFEKYLKEKNYSYILFMFFEIVKSENFTLINIFLQKEYMFSQERTFEMSQKEIFTKALFYAVEKSNINLVKFFEEKGGDIKTGNEIAFKTFIINGTVEDVTYFLNKGVSEESMIIAKYNAKVYNRKEILKLLERH
jgi:hypothetical protein